MLTVAVLLAVLATCESKDASMSPTFSAENLNVTIHWNRPNITEPTGNEVLLYTVVNNTAGKKERKNVPWCVNITETVCRLVELFPAEGEEFAMNEMFFIRYMSSVNQSVKGRSKGSAFLDRHVSISGPVIYNVTTTSTDAIISVHGPKTPFIKNNRSRLMGEDRLGRRLVTSRFSVDYASSLTNLDHPDEKPKNKDWTRSQFGNLSIRYRFLEPYTNYRITIRARLDTSSKQSKVPTTTDFRTKQEAPEFAPQIMGTKTLKSSCDVRDIRVRWQESPSQRESVDITKYTVTAIGKKSNESESVVLHGHTSSVTLMNLNRWEEYELYVSSTNSQGSSNISVHNIAEDKPDKDSYKPANINITHVSNQSWEIVWAPPTLHQECTLGFRVTTVRTRDRVQEENVTVLGHNKSSAMLHFQKVAMYTVFVTSIMNDSAMTEVTAAVEYIVEGKLEDDEGWKIPQWAILTSVIILLTIILIAVIFISNKMCCDLQEVPDISKSRPMLIASRNEGYVPTLKSPPEKEVFHKPSSHPNKVTETMNDVNCSYSDDEVFESKARCVDSSTSMPNYIRLDHSPELIDGSSPESVTTNEGVNTADEVSQSEETTDTPTVTGPPTDVHDVTCRDGYVSYSSSYKVTQKDSVCISDHYHGSFRTGNLSTQSSDSGISSTTYGGSVSDYVPPSPFSDSDQGSMFYGYDSAPTSPYVAAALVGSSGSGPPSPFSDSDHSNTFSAYDFETATPYVTAGLLATPRRLLSTRTLSQPDEEQSSYKQIDSRDSLQSTRGYLPMIPASPCKKSEQ